MSQDFVPQPDDEFDHFAAIFVPWVVANGATHGVSAGQISDLQSFSVAWGYAWNGFTNVRTAFHAATEDKKVQRTPYEQLIRVVAGVIQKNPATTDTDRANAHITVPKGTHTPSTTPTTTPMLQKADVSTRAIIRLFIADSTTPEKLAKPENARSVQIWEQIGGAAPVDPETMDYLGDESRMPYRADFDAADIGKTVWLAFRWIGKNNQPGPWSTIYAQTIPG